MWLPHRMRQPVETHFAHFLGMAGYYAKFIPRYDKVVDLLWELQRKDTPFIWDIRRQASFEEMKWPLTSKCLQLFDPALETIVTTQAFTVGLGAVLQRCQSKKLVTIAFASRRLRDQEKKYLIGKLEALARTWALEGVLVGGSFCTRTNRHWFEC